MPSTPRGFLADVPVLVTTRCTLRADFFKDRDMERRFRQLIARFGNRCGVRVFAWVLMRNHLHMLVSQDFPGQDRRRRKGISPFLRDVFSVLAKRANELNSSQGHVFEQVFHSRNRPDAEEVFAAFAYILTNPMHHGAARRIDTYEASSAKVCFSAEPDGAVNAILGLFGRLDGTSKEKGVVIRRLVQEWFDLVEAAGEGANKVAIARELLHKHRAMIDMRAASRPIPIAAWVGQEAAKKARDGILAGAPLQAQNESGATPRVADLIRVDKRSVDARPASWAREEKQDEIA